MHFSIIIPTLNEEHFVDKLLEDLTRQTFKDFEVVHVDGGSNDATCAVVSAFKDRCNLISMLAAERGPALQRNEGAKMASGTYLVFVDADTRIPDPNFLAHLAKETHTSGCLVIFPFMEAHTNDLGIKIAFKVYNMAIEVARIMPKPLNTMGIAVLEKSFFNHLGGYIASTRHKKSKLFAEDHDIIIRARSAGVIGGVAPKARYQYSLRRFEQEGYLSVVPKYILSMVERTLGKEFVELNYEMGGHLYKPTQNTHKHKKH